METYILWDTDAEKEAKFIDIPDCSFDCPKMNKGDILSFDIQTSAKKHILTAVKISHVHVEVGWRKTKTVTETNKAIQWIYVTPEIFESPPDIHIPVETTNKKHRFPS